MRTLRERLIAVNLPGRVEMRTPEDAADMAMVVFSNVLREWSAAPGMQYRAESELLRRSREIFFELWGDADGSSPSHTCQEAGVDDN